MDRLDFIKACNNNSEIMNREHCKDIIKKSIEKNNAENPYNSYGHGNLIVCMEELAELIQALSKELRNKGDSINILEETADVLIAIGYIQEIMGFTDNSIISAINVKIDRLSKLLEEK